MVIMIIKGLFHKYEKWNPVHPTSGTFWGMGIGIGCGVGWGPGFGPEVIGYVGAGCGVGFSVGLTLAGVGVGLPAGGLVQVPFNAFAVTGSNALEFAKSRVVPVMRNAAGDGWAQASRHFHVFQTTATKRLSMLKVDHTHHPIAVDPAEFQKKLTLASAFLVRLRDTCLSFGKTSGTDIK